MDARNWTTPDFAGFFFWKLVFLCFPAVSLLDSSDKSLKFQSLACLNRTKHFADQPFQLAYWRPHENCWAPELLCHRANRCNARQEWSQFARNTFRNKHLQGVLTLDGEIAMFKWAITFSAWNVDIDFWPPDWGTFVRMSACHTRGKHFCFCFDISAFFFGHFPHENVQQSKWVLVK